MRPTHKRDYLITDARIIAEDATHISIALTLPKRWINRNLPFFAALADHAGSGAEIELIAHK